MIFQAFSDFFFVNKFATQLLFLLLPGEIRVFHGHCTSFPVAYSIPDDKLLGPIGWK